MKYIALLRGINVGGNNKVEMSKLKKVFEELGFTNIITYINSGNVIFESAQKQPKNLAKQIEQAIHKQFGFTVRTLVKTHRDIQKLCEALPAEWKNDVDQKTDILFLWDKFDNKRSVDLLSAKPGIDNLKYSAGTIIWNLDKRNYNKSAMRKFIGTTLYKNMTARNINTVRKLAELMN